jgi:hypothetical protein
VLILPMLFGAFQPPSPHRATHHGFSLGLRTKDLLASSYLRRLHLHSRQPYRRALPLRGRVSERGVVFRLTAAAKNEDCGYPVVLPQPIDETLAICAQLSRCHSQLVATLHGLLCDPQQVFPAAPLTAVATLLITWQGIAETPADVSSEREQR